MTKRVGTIEPRREPAWLEGVYLGTLRASNGYIIGIRQGGAKAHPNKRLFDVELWGVDLLSRAKDIAWNPSPNGFGFNKVPTRFGE